MRRIRTSASAAGLRGRRCRSNACRPSPSSRRGPRRGKQLFPPSLQLNNHFAGEVALKYVATALFTAVFTAVVVSAFWIWFYNVVPQAQPAVERSGNVVAVVPPRAPPVAVAEQVVVGPAGLALPVLGVKSAQLTDTFTQARANGRRHDAIDIMAPQGT